MCSSVPADLASNPFVPSQQTQASHVPCYITQPLPHLYQDFMATSAGAGGGGVGHLPVPGLQGAQEAPDSAVPSYLLGLREDEMQILLDALDE